MSKFNSRVLICTTIIFSALALMATDRPAAIAATNAAATFDVRTFGAVGDGKSDDTAAIQKAVDAASSAGGGTVVVPTGTYRCVAIKLKSHITLQLDAGAVLQGPSKIADYPKYEGGKGSGWSGSMYGIIAAEDVTDVTITGQGQIDGNGAESWEIEKTKRDANKAAGAKLKAGAASVERPRMVQFNRCHNIHVSGVTLSNSQMWTLVFNGCENIEIDGLTIKAPADSPETDGIDIRGCYHTRITHCHIDNGDDNVAITGSRQTPVQGHLACEDVEISDCTFLHGHGVSIGSITVNGVRNVRVHDCTFEGTTNGIRIKSMRDRGGIVEDIHYSNLKMTRVNPAITINAYYQRPPEHDDGQPVNDTTPIFRDIFISNLVATDCPKAAGMIVGLPESEVSNVVLDNVKISAATGMTISHATGLIMKNVQVDAKNGPPFIASNSKIEGLPVTAPATQPSSIH